MELAQRLEHKGGGPGTPDGRCRQRADLGNDAGMVDREQPRSTQRGSGDPDCARRGGRGVAQPAAFHPPLEPEAIVPRRLLRLRADDEAGRVFDLDQPTTSPSGADAATLRPCNIHYKNGRSAHQRCL